MEIKNSLTSIMKNIYVAIISALVMVCMSIILILGLKGVLILTLFIALLSIFLEDVSLYIICVYLSMFSINSYFRIYKLFKLNKNVKICAWIMVLWLIIISLITLSSKQSVMLRTFLLVIKVQCE